MLPCTQILIPSFAGRNFFRLCQLILSPGSLARVVLAWMGLSSFQVWLCGSKECTETKCVTHYRPWRATRDTCHHCVAWAVSSGHDIMSFTITYTAKIPVPYRFSNCTAPYGSSGRWEKAIMGKRRVMVECGRLWENYIGLNSRELNCWCAEDRVKSQESRLKTLEEEDRPFCCSEFQVSEANQGLPRSALSERQKLGSPTRSTLRFSGLNLLRVSLAGWLLQVWLGLAGLLSSLQGYFFWHGLDSHEPGCYSTHFTNQLSLVVDQLKARVVWVRYRNEVKKIRSIVRGNVSPYYK